MAPTDISAFAATQLSLLDAELQAEVAETSTLISQSSPGTLQRAGLALTNLVVTSQRTGFGGKTIIELEPDSAVGGGGLPLEHGIRTGDIVSIREQSGGSAKKKVGDQLQNITGVVTRVRGSHVSVALDKEDEDVPNKRFWVLVYGDDGGAADE